MQSRLTLSKAFSKSMKIICRSDRNSLHCSMMILTELMWSVHDEPAHIIICGDFNINHIRNGLQAELFCDDVTACGFILLISIQHDLRQIGNKHCLTSWSAPINHKLLKRQNVFIIKLSLEMTSLTRISGKIFARLVLSRKVMSVILILKLR